MKIKLFKLVACLLFVQCFSLRCMDSHLTNILNSRNLNYCKTLSLENLKSALDIISALNVNESLQHSFLRTKFFKNKNFGRVTPQAWLATQLSRIKPVLEQQIVGKFQYHNLQPKWRFKNDPNPVRDIWYSPDGNWLVSTEIRNGRSGLYRRSLRELSNKRSNGNPYPSSLINWAPRSVSFSKDSKYLVASGGNAFEIWEVVSRKCIKKVKTAVRNSMKSVCFSPDGRFIAALIYVAGKQRFTTNIFDATTGECVKAFAEGNIGVCIICYSPDGQHLLTAGASKTIKLWNIESGQCIKTLRGHLHTVSLAVYSPNGQYIATASDNEMVIKIWDIQTGQCIHTLKNHYKTIRSLDFSPCGNYLISGAGKTIKIWDVDSGNCLINLKYPGTNVNSVKYSSDGNYIAACGGYVGIVVWENPLKDMNIEAVEENNFEPATPSSSSSNQGINQQKQSLHTMQASKNSYVKKSYGAIRYRRRWRREKEANISPSPLIDSLSESGLVTPLENSDQLLNTVFSPLKDPVFSESEVIAPLEKIEESQSSSSSILEATKISSGKNPVQLKECGICLDDKAESDFAVLGCGHAYCKECFNHQLDIELREKSVANLKCPECRLPMEELDIREITPDKNKWEAFVNIATLRALEIDKNIKQCPTADCPNMFIPGDQRAKINCLKCNVSYCSHCLLDHAANILCKQAEANRITDPQNEEWRHANNVKECPQCGMWVEKDGGCEFIECSQCKYGFCWKCLGPHNHNMTTHKCRPLPVQLRNQNRAPHDQRVNVPQNPLNPIVNRQQPRRQIVAGRPQVRIIRWAPGIVASANLLARNASLRAKQARMPICVTFTFDREVNQEFVNNYFQRLKALTRGSMPIRHGKNRNHFILKISNTITRRQFEEILNQVNAAMI